MVQVAQVLHMVVLALRPQQILAAEAAEAAEGGLVPVLAILTGSTAAQAALAS